MKTLIFICLLLCLMSPTFAITDEITDIIDYELLPLLQEDQRALYLFASELNISNGDPYTRDYGERGMFGRLESAESVCKRTDLNSEDIYTEVVRLLLGPFYRDGSTVFSFKRVGRGKVLDYDTGKWVSTDGGLAIRIKHITEYCGKTRIRFLLLDHESNPPMIYRKAT